MLNQNYRDSYIYATLLIISLILSSTLYHNSYYKLAILNNKMRTSIISVIYRKISGLTQYVIQSTDSGKILNMIANDFNLMENKLILLFRGIGFPVVYIGSTIVLVFRLGWKGLLCICIPLLFLPLQGLLGKFNGRYL